MISEQLRESCREDLDKKLELIISRCIRTKTIAEDWDFLQKRCYEYIAALEDPNSDEKFLEYLRGYIETEYNRLNNL